MALVTYNTVGSDLSSGWHESNGRRALVLQNTKSQSWAVDANDRGLRDKILEHSSRGDHSLCCDQRRDEIGSLWRQLQEELPNLDHVVIYVGTGGSERAIELAAQLSASKVTLVLCDCGLAYKLAMIWDAGLRDARQLDCECGGHRSMRGLYDRFMETGELMPIEG